MRSNVRYIAPEQPAANALRLHCNEGAVPPVSASVARQYPDVSRLRAQLASRLGLASGRVVVTSGADGAIDRVMRVFAGPGRRVVVADPTFEMIPVYAAQTGAEVVRVPWTDAYPVEEIVDARPDVVAIVTPDNPTGRTVDWETVARVATSLPDACVLLDLAYTEYATEDLTARAAGLPNVVVTRTLSKAWGLAGLRVGYALAALDVAERLRAAGSPYPVSAASIDIATRCLAQPAYVADHVATVRDERDVLARELRGLGARTLPSEANFVFARFDDAAFVADGLRVAGIEVRRFDRPGLDDALRIGCPGFQSGLQRLLTALRQTVQPQALLFDMDGVLADVRYSYREAVIETCASWGVDVTAADVAAEKTNPDSNDDFEVTRRMLAARGVNAPFELVAGRFQTAYDEGLWAREELLPGIELLEELSTEYALGVVTGRPRPDAERFLRHHGLEQLFDTVVCREDAAMKPNPAPVRLALQNLGVQTAWMFGDTVDDVRAARDAGVLPIGVPAPDENTAELLKSAGATAVVRELREATKWLS